MAKRGLSPATEIANLKPRDRRYEVPDPGCQGLWVAVQPSGRKGFAFRYRRPDTKRPAKLTIGSWHEGPKGKQPKPVLDGGGVSLAGARMLAAAALHDLNNGIDPGAQKIGIAARGQGGQGQHPAARRREVPAVRGAEVAHAPPASERVRAADLSRAGANPIADIKRRDVVALLDEVQAENGPRMADECLSSLSRLSSPGTRLETTISDRRSCVAWDAPSRHTSAPAPAYWTTMSCGPCGRRHNKWAARRAHTLSSCC